MRSSTVLGRRQHSRGLSLVGFLFLVLLAVGIYSVAFKPGNGAASKGADAAAPVELRVVVYTRPSCEPCDRAKAWLTSRQIAFEERDVEVSSAYADELKNYESLIVPVIVVNGKPQYGFHSATLEDVLKKEGRPTR